MGSVLLVIHLMVAILLVVLILMQRNSGNALSGLGGGNGADSFLSARGKGNLLTRTTAVLATVFLLLRFCFRCIIKAKPESRSQLPTLRLWCRPNRRFRAFLMPLRKIRAQLRQPLIQLKIRHRRLLRRQHLKLRPFRQRNSDMSSIRTENKGTFSGRCLFHCKI